MNVSSLLSREEPKHDHDHGHDHHHHNHKDGESCSSCGHDHSHTPIRLKQTLAGLLFTINSFIVEWMQLGPGVAEVSAMIGAGLLGTPILLTAIKDLRMGRLSTTELVGLAVLASFASGHFQEAGVVAFFMLLGELIETHTAEGARNSIESLIKLTPTKARRIKADNPRRKSPPASSLSATSSASVPATMWRPTASF
jgi:Cd2+/Zn2+-exporting ATPase